MIHDAGCKIHDPRSFSLSKTPGVRCAEDGCWFVYACLPTQQVLWAEGQYPVYPVNPVYGLFWRVRRTP